MAKGRTLIVVELSRETVENVARILGPQSATALALERASEYEQNGKSNIKFFHNVTTNSVLVVCDEIEHKAKEVNG